MLCGTYFLAEILNKSLSNLLIQNSFIYYAFIKKYKLIYLLVTQILYSIIFYFLIASYSQFVAEMATRRDKTR